MTTILVPGVTVNMPTDADVRRNDFGLSVTTRQAVQTSAATRSAGALVSLEGLADDDLIELEYGQDIREWTTVGALRARYGQLTTRSAGGADVIALPLQTGAATSRGLDGGLVLKGLKWLGIDLEDAVARQGVQATIRYFEDKLDPHPGLYQVDRTGRFAREITSELPPSDQPLLLLIHGTFSTTAAAFHNLFGTPEWRRLHQHFGERIYALEHRTLSEGPAQNARYLVQLLPKNARLQVISHSRGGLVGELLCLGSATDADYRYFQDSKGDYRAQIEALSLFSEQMRQKQISVERFVRVACPAGGTLLADERFDRYLSIILNLVGLTPALRASPIYDFVEACVLTLVKKRADPTELPGLEAMMPLSPLIRLLNQPGRPQQDDLAIIAGDIEGEGLWGSLKVLATDLYYREDHDLVVNTAAMKGGLARATAYMAQHKGAQVHHGNYFYNEASRQQVADWLTRRFKSDRVEGFAPLAAPRLLNLTGIGATARGADDHQERPVLLFLPDCLGTHLKAGNDRVWLDEANLAAGMLGRLAFVRGRSPGDVTTDGLVAPPVQELLTALQAHFIVEPMAYDWRQSLADEARAVGDRIDEWLRRTTQPVYLLAHGSGGLVARGVQVFAQARWQGWAERGGRLLLLGTPNGGTHAALHLLTGAAPLVQMLAALDPTRDAAAIAQLLRTFPGLIELLPADSPAWQLDWWTGDRRLLAPKEEGPFGAALAAAAAVRQQLAAAVDRERMILVLGEAAQTPVTMHLHGAASLQVENSAHGDGVVTHELGWLAVKSAWKAPVAHGDLTQDARLFSAWVELLTTGNSANPMLQAVETPPTVAAARGAATAELSQTRHARLVNYPSRGDLLAAAFGSRGQQFVAESDADLMELHVSVKYCSLEYASNPLAIGHYDGDMIVGAEAVLDERLGNRLRDRRLMNLYPGPVGTVEVILDRAAWPPGGLIIGLGEVGQVIPETITRGITQAALRYALAVNEAPLRDGENAQCPRSAAFSALLIGTRGGRALTIESSVAAIITGALLANRILRERGLSKQVCIDAIEFVEVYEDIATRAAHAARDWPLHLRILPEKGERITAQSFLQRGRGGLAGQPTFEYDAGWWRRLRISEQPRRAADACASAGALEFLLLTDRARAEYTLQATQRTLVDGLVAQTINNTSRDLDLPATLYELLIPNHLKDEAQEAGNLLLVLDRQAAQYPWEMLAERRLDLSLGAMSSERWQPLAVRIGLLRQLTTAHYRAQVQAPRGNHALVIGDPYLEDDPSYPPLRGAREEASAVATELRAHGYTVTELIGARAHDIVTALYQHEYRIVHIASHGVFDTQCPARCGAVIGKEVYLTAAEIGQLRIVPQLVFLNCCHLARLDDAPAGAARPALPAWNQLAASIAEALIQIGVRAVVAAGWAVDDRAAKTFAVDLYNFMLTQEHSAHFGEAVRHARETTYNDHPFTNSWGAYQCYGDPAFTLFSEPGAGALAHKFVAHHEILRELRNLQTRLSRPVLPTMFTRIKSQLTQLDEQLGDHWRTGALLAVLGETYGELGEFQPAITCYRKALEIAQPEELIAVRAVEQLANLEARYAVRLALDADRESDHSATAPCPWTSEELLADAETKLKALLAIGASAERYALLGSYYKRCAIIAGADDGKRNAALDAAAEAYAKVATSKNARRDEKNYGLLNLAICRLFRDPALGDEARNEIRAQIEEARERLPTLQVGKTIFWDDVAVADIALAKAIFDAFAPKGEKKNEEIKKIGDYYATAIARGATVRERSTVIEHLEFVITMLEKASRKPQALINELKKIQQAMAAQ